MFTGSLPTSNTAEATHIIRSKRSHPKDQDVQDCLLDHTQTSHHNTTHQNKTKYHITVAFLLATIATMFVDFLAIYRVASVNVY